MKRLTLALAATLLAALGVRAHADSLPPGASDIVSWGSGIGQTFAAPETGNPAGEYFPAFLSAANQDDIAVDFVEPGSGAISDTIWQHAGSFYFFSDPDGSTPFVDPSGSEKK